MKYVLSIAVLCFSIQCACQHTKISGKILEQGTLRPLELATVNIPEQGIGVITNAHGEFSISLLEISEHQNIRISSMGFETVDLPLSNAIKLLQDTKGIILKPKVTHLQTVMLKNAKRTAITLGNLDFNHGKMGYWQGEYAKGGEIASVVKIDHRKTRLHKLRFRVLRNQADSIQIRVKIYEYDGGDPGKILIDKEIVHSITGGDRLEWINLYPYDIVVDNDIAISLELLDYYGERNYLAIAGRDRCGSTYIRQPGERHWEFQGKGCIALQLDCSYPLHDEVKISSF